MEKLIDELIRELVPGLTESGMREAFRKLSKIIFWGKEFQTINEMDREEKERFIEVLLILGTAEANRPERPVKPLKQKIETINWNNGKTLADTLSELRLH